MRLSCTSFVRLASVGLSLAVAVALLGAAPAAATDADDAFVEQLNAMADATEAGTPVQSDDDRGGAGECFVSADCGSDPDVSCSGSSCSGKDRNCAAGERGRVTCNGVTKFCATRCPTVRTCTADCGGGRTISCQFSSTCQRADRNCSIGQTGFVRCDGSPLFRNCGPCPACPQDFCTTNSCNDDDDCCGNVDGGGLCRNGRCVCP